MGALCAFLLAIPGFFFATSGLHATQGMYATGWGLAPSTSQHSAREDDYAPEGRRWEGWMTCLCFGVLFEGSAGVSRLSKPEVSKHWCDFVRVLVCASSLFGLACIIRDRYG